MMHSRAINDALHCTQWCTPLHPYRNRNIAWQIFATQSARKKREAKYTHPTRRTGLANLCSSGSDACFRAACKRVGRFGLVVDTQTRLRTKPRSVAGDIPIAPRRRLALVHALALARAREALRTAHPPSEQNYCLPNPNEEPNLCAKETKNR